MWKRIRNWLYDRVIRWLNHEQPNEWGPLCDMERLRYEIRPGDIILVEGRTRVSEVIKILTQSPWSHSALYLGRLYDIEDPDMRDCVQYFYDGDPNEQLVIEALLGRGTIISPLSSYQNDHLRICRPKNLSPEDSNKVIAYALKQLGSDYDVRQLLDLGRFLFPWTILPRRWRSSLFNHNAGQPTRTVCSCMLAEAYASVDFPVLPFVLRREDGATRVYKRNPKLFTPRDFDYSPYFDIIKYPYLGLDEMSVYRSLPWQEDRVIDDDKPIKSWPVSPSPSSYTHAANRWDPLHIIGSHQSGPLEH